MSKKHYLIQKLVEIHKYLLKESLLNFGHICNNDTYNNLVGNSEDAIIFHIYTYYSTISAYFKSTFV